MFGTEAAIGRSQQLHPAATAQGATEEGWAIQEGVPVAPRTSTPDSGLPDGRFLDREESWLRFNQRVLELAEDPSTPLLDVLAGRDVTVVSYAGWLRVEQAEADLAAALGRGARVKLASRDEIDALCRPPE